MRRRVALKNLGLITGGILFLPSCNFSEEKAAIALNKLQITKNQETLLMEIVDTMLPEGTIRGAKTLGVHNFVWIMIDDCANSKKQETFINGLNLFDEKVRNTAKNSFDKLSKDEKLHTLTYLMDMNSEEKDLTDFLQTTKSYAIWGFKQSEYFMTEIMPYNLVPGTFGLCETIDNSTKINTNA